MNRITIIPLLVAFLVISCSKDSNENYSDSTLKIQPDFTQKIYYKNNTYEIGFKENGEGEYHPITKIPMELQNLEEKPNLATVIDGDDIYLFDDEKSKFAFYNMDYSAIITSRKNNLTSKTNKNEASALAAGPSISFTVSNFNANVLCFEDIHYKKEKLIISNFSQLRDLHPLKFGNKISSLRINTAFVYSYPNHSERRKIIFYQHPEFDGRSIEFYTNYRLPAPYTNYFGHRDLTKLKHGFLNLSNWNDKISSIDVIQGNTSLIN
ncbi:hypothetical protein [Zobellia galactanivorans]|uniref:Hypothetical lipoprotein n=1 Tax=Zobellia galactanivorans (strain DSM 12802 / CCUG 47099 / CIP 106680 / NCIMB 13871 / Dsij) TaxID=63186 RepID=G0L5Z1_ZOBGA|nr:hypothetical protein [Zobellia galactanivorans]CAZ96613.1 Hypothetical lipoprotein [Zobellia galactanivorans]